MWGDLEVEGFVENLFFSSTISDRCVTGTRYQLEELVIGLTKGSFYGLCQGSHRIVVAESIVRLVSSSFASLVSDLVD